ncbi:TPA_asm: P6 [Begonia betacytorhabdovirus 1]|nr:TPA_asm: P6 [Begonia betacytorhabdovirus 1]
MNIRDSYDLISGSSEPIREILQSLGLISIIILIKIYLLCKCFCKRCRRRWSAQAHRQGMSRYHRAREI